MSVGGFVNLGRDVIADALIGGVDYARYNNANAHFACGNSATAYAAAQTDLQGASKARLPMLATYPQRAANVLTFAATADGSTANFAWSEWGIFNHLTTGQMLVRFVEALGTKASGATWNVTATVTIVLP